MIEVITQKFRSKVAQTSSEESPKKSWRKSKEVLAEVQKSPGESPKNFEKAQQDCVERPKKLVWNNQVGSDLTKKELFKSDRNSR
jgi:hypothetical protein